MKREIKFFPAWDKTDPDPKKNYGVSDLEICFQVIGELGITEFQLSTNWYLEHVMERRLQFMKKDVWGQKEDFLLRKWIRPFPLDFCYYSPVRRSEDDAYWEDGSAYHAPEIGSPCYYGWKYSDEKENKPAHDVAYYKLVSEGDGALWKYLEDYYVEVFGELR